jgi:hypothetical protein
MSSKRQGLASKLLTVLGGAGLAISLCAAGVGAQNDPAIAAPVPPWNNANFASRYICNVDSTTATIPVAVPPAIPVAPAQSYYTGIMKLNPNGSGFFQGGTLDATVTSFTGTLPANPSPVANFCSYTLDPGSIYTVNQDGTGLLSLMWDAPSTAVNPACPATFTMTASIVLRNNVTANNTVPRVDMTLNNFLNLKLSGATTGESGHGYCLK